MESIIRNVRDIDTRERKALEHVLGHQLKENQQIIIQVVTVSAAPDSQDTTKVPDQAGKLPEWCNVFAGLTDDEMTDVESAIHQRADLTRPSE